MANDLGSNPGATSRKVLMAKAFSAVQKSNHLDLNTTLNFGVFIGQLVSEIVVERPSYFLYLAKNGYTLSTELKQFIERAESVKHQEVLDSLEEDVPFWIILLF